MDKYGNYLPRYVILDGGVIFTGYVDLKGNSIERTPQKYPYSYGPYVVWKSLDFCEDCCSADYSDRLWQWNPDKFNKCCKEVWGDKGQYFDIRTPQEINKFLNLYFDKKVKLTAIMKGANLSSGFPYWIFYYESLEDSK